MRINQVSNKEGKWTQTDTNALRMQIHPPITLRAQGGSEERVHLSESPRGKDNLGDLKWCELRAAFNRVLVALE